MAPAITYALPAMQLMCHLIVPQTPSLNIGNNPGPILTEQTTVEPVVQQDNIDDNPAQEPLPPGYVAHPDIGVAYKVSTDKANLKTAKTRCMAENAHLAVIDSSVKFERLLSQSGSITNIFVGIIRMYDDTEWVNINTGATIAQVPWAAGEPFGTSDCVRTSTSPRGLINYSCTDEYHWACEIRAEATIDQKDDTEGNSTTHIPEGYTRFPDVNAAYKIYAETATWYQGRDRCIADGARLAMADSVDKIRAINSIKTNNNRWLHVGFFRRESQDPWIRLDTDASVTSLPWAEDNPDGTGNCAGIAMAPDGLVDYECEWTVDHFVCEIPL